MSVFDALYRSFICVYVCLHILVSAVIFLSEGSDDDVVTVL